MSREFIMNIEELPIYDSLSIRVDELSYIVDSQIEIIKDIQKRLQIQSMKSSCDMMKLDIKNMEFKITFYETMLSTGWREQANSEFEMRRNIVILKSEIDDKRTHILDISREIEQISHN